MKSLITAMVLAGVLLVCFAGCAGTSAEIPDTPSLAAGEETIEPVLSSPPAATESTAPSPEKEETEPAGQEPEPANNILHNNTADMTIMVPLYNLAAEEAEEPGAVACRPGESLLLSQRIMDFSFETPSFSASQEFFDLYLYGDGSAPVLEFTGDVDEGYRLLIYNEDEAAPCHQYLLESGMLDWVPVLEGQKLFFTDLPWIPMEEILEIYPDAVLPEGFLEVGWPDGYTSMLWCREPLYDVRICGTGYAIYTQEEGIRYLSVDWDSVEGFDLLPQEPRFISMVSIGSSYLRAFRFTDSQGQEHIYLLGENGRGGDYSTLIFFVTENVRFAPNDVE